MLQINKSSLTLLLCCNIAGERRKDVADGRRWWCQWKQIKHNIIVANEGGSGGEYSALRFSIPGSWWHWAVVKKKAGLWTVAVLDINVEQRWYGCVPGRELRKLCFQVCQLTTAIQSVLIYKSEMGKQMRSPSNVKCLKKLKERYNWHLTQSWMQCMILCCCKRVDNCPGL